MEEEFPFLYIFQFTHEFCTSLQILRASCYFVTCSLNPSTATFFTPSSQSVTFPPKALISDLEDVYRHAKYPGRFLDRGTP
jgi:hypothetical protein